MTIRPLYPGEPIDFMLYRLKKALKKADMDALLRRSERFVPKGEQRRIKQRRARARAA